MSTVYLKAFEKKVVEAGVMSGLFDKSAMVPLRPGKLSRTPFGLFVGLTIDSPLSFAIDYYGLIKPSLGLRRDAQMSAQQYYGKQIKKMEAILIHFASVKIEDVDSLSNSELTAGFPKFKSLVLEMRGFGSDNSVS